KRISVSAVGLLSLFVGGHGGGIAGATPAQIDDTPVPGKKRTLPPVLAEFAPRASPRQDAPTEKELPKLIARYFEGNVGRRFYIQVDKPLYKPGETIWLKTWDLKARALSGADTTQTTIELVSPKGATVLKKKLRTDGGSATNDFELPAEVQGGEYTLRAVAGDGQKAERAIIVSAYEPPRLKKKLEFVKKAYGAGDQVSAAVEVARPTGEALAGKALIAVITVDGVELPRVKVSSNSEGSAIVKFDLPKSLSTGDGLLTILVEDGGITESISKAIPILQRKVALAFFPEGGKMVGGLPTRLYFEARTLLGKPADVEGRLVDDLGNAVATFGTYKNGLGRVEFTPATGRRYQAEITRPSTVTEKYALPLVEDKGCVMRTYDDFDGQEKALRVGVRCTQRQKVIVAATVRDNVLDVGSVEAGDDAPGVIYLAAGDNALQRAAGVARITVFDQNLDPLAERLTFRNRRARLAVKIEQDRKTYAPRGQVALAITTRDAAGKLVPAELAVSVVDDTVVSFADDKSGHLLSKLLLEPELPGKVEEPNFYLDLTEAQSALALDLLMGARGYRRFDWVAVLRPPVPTSAVANAMGGMRARDALEVDRRAMVRPLPAAAPVMRPPLQAADAPELRDERKHDAPLREPIRQRRGRADAVEAGSPAPREMQPGPALRNEIAEDKDFARAAAKKAVVMPEELAWAPVRVFPVPVFNADYAGPREDYRETVFWAPSVKTDKTGRANVKFVLSDAVTSFRVFSEGVGGGAAGRDETVFKSSLPFSLAVKLPLEVSAGDHPLIPVTLSNESERTMDVKLDAAFGALMQASGTPGRGGTLAAGQRKSLFFRLDVTGTRGISDVRLSAAAGGLKDEVLRNIPVVPLGFPQLFERSGQIAGETSYAVDLGKARKGSVQASVKVYTSMLATTMSGLDGMLREPAGCFEQTSSTNYPNVMIM
ncbi:MAG: MG2 domain-containing protein, partial [Betaproteobacteria bacterium]